MAFFVIESEQLNSIMDKEKINQFNVLENRSLTKDINDLNKYNNYLKFSQEIVSIYLPSLNCFLL